MLARLTIRLGSSLVGIAVGIVISGLALSRFSISVPALVQATLVFWFVHLATQFLALKVLVRQPSIALAGLLAVASTIVALIIVTIIISGLKIRGLNTYVFATLIIWVTSSISDVAARHLIRRRRDERKAQPA